MHQMREVLKLELAARRARPADDLMTALADIGNDEIVSESPDAVAALILVAGSVTTTAALEHGLLLLMMHPDQRARMLATAEGARIAINEIVRLPSASPRHGQRGVGGLLRYAAAEISIADALIGPGELVILNHHRANLDHERFEQPLSFDCGQQRASHLGFGRGPHRCPGEHLARLELECFFTSLFRRFPGLRLSATTEADLKTTLQTGQMPTTIAIDC